MNLPFRWKSRPSSPRAKRQRLLEPLEPRLVLDGTVVFNEIMYHPAGEDGSLEWIELYNQNGVNMDISGWRLTNGVQFKFPEGTIIEGLGQLVVAANPAGLQAATGYSGAMGPYTGRISNGGETLELRNNSGRLVDELDFGDSDPWPVAADGLGATMAKRDQNSASALARNWVNSQQFGGTPGDDNFPKGGQREDIVGAAGTGVRDNGQLLSPGDTDPHWTVNETGQSAIVMTPNSLWARNTASAQWIGQVASGDADVPPGRITYSTTFDLSEVDHTSAELTMSLVAADQIVDVLLNGTSLGFSQIGFQRISRPFDITEGFLPEENTLQVVTQNFGGPAGLLAELSGKATTRPIVNPFAGLMFNEVAAAGDMDGFVEVTNRGDEAIAISGLQIKSSGGPLFTFGDASLSPGQHVAVTVAQLGFDLSADDTLLLLAESGSRIIDAVQVTAQHQGRSEAHDLRWFATTIATPGENNAFDFQSDVVINEIMYHAPGTPAIQGLPDQFAETTLVGFDANWRYTKDFNFGPNDPPVDPGPNWAETAHPVDGVNWLEAQGPIGFATGRLPVRLSKQLVNPTLVSNYITTYYFETEFGLTQEQIDNMDRLVLNHEIDDGAVFYVNGSEVARFNLPEGAVEFNTLATNDVERAVLTEDVVLAMDNLVALPAMNRLSVEVHQSSTDSPDVVFGAELIGAELVTPGFPSAPPTESDEEWIELFNRNATESIDLSGWRFTDGINYDFPAGTIIGPRGYLVVASNPAALLAKHASLDPSIVVGPFSGRLADGGELIQLTDADDNPADHVPYWQQGRWPSTADGGWSSLELRDPDADNSVPESWAASDETDGGTWTTYTYSGPGTNAIRTDPSRYNEFIFGLLEAGEFLIDDISVIQNPGTPDARQLIQNGTFESDEIGGQPAKWRIIGNQHGTVVADPDDPTNKVVHLRAAGPTEHMHNHAETTLKAGDEFVRLSQIGDDSTFEISFRAKWLAGSNQLNTRLYFNRLARKTLLETPDAIGTPGAANSTLVENLGPTYDGLRHAPVVPDPSEDVTVSIVAADPDGVSSMTLWYSVDNSPFSSVPMTESHDGHYVGTIPGQAAASIVQFYVEGQDGQGITSTFPARGPESRALYKVQDGESNFDNGVHNFRIVMTPADTEFLHTSTNVQSNEPMGTTIIYDEQEVFYDTTLRLKGSERGRDQPIRVGFLVKFDPMQPFRGVYETIGIDRSGAGDEFSQKEILVKHGIHHAGNIPSPVDDLIHVIAPRTAQTGSAMLMPGFREYYLDTAYETGGAGTVFEYELIYNPNGTVGGDPEALKLPLPDSVVGATVNDYGPDRETYRWYWLIKDNRGEDDYRQLIAALQALSQPAGEKFHADTRRLLDVDTWLRSFAVQTLYGISDSYANNSNAHNAYFYARPDGKTLYFPYDMDFTFSQGATSGLVSNTELRKLITDPGNEHAYFGHIQDILQTTFNSDYMNPWIDHYQSKLERNNFQSFKNYIATRSAFALGQLPDQVDFAVTPSGPIDVGDASTATINGTGWVNVREIHLQGRPQPLSVTWTDVTSWEATVPVNNQTSALTFEAYDFHGELIGTSEVTVSSTAVNPVTDSLRITEINYNPYDPTADESAVNPGLNNDDFEFVELQNVGDAAINLLNTRFASGIDFTFPAVLLASGDRAVVVRNSDAFHMRYGNDVQIVGQYTGSLSNAGERISLVDSQDATILDFSYGDNTPWPESADGRGATLQLIDAANTSADQYGSHSSWRASTDFGGSPGAEGTPPRGVVINEVLSNTDTPSDQTDAIELFNTTGDTVDVSGWYLSDSANSPLKYRIPAGTTIAPSAYLVFDESQFNPNPASPGPNDFALSGSRGDDVYLVIADSRGGIAEFVDEVHFRAARSGESFGRNPNGTGVLTPMSTLTLGAANSAPRVGPLVISEIQYNPAEPSTDVLAIDPELTPDDLEYVEIFNGGTSAVSLSQWRLRGGIDFDFDVSVTLPVGGVVVVIPFDPANPSNAERAAAFRSHYGLGENALPIGGYQGQLNDDGETIELLRPDAPPADDPGFVPYVLEDEVTYDDVEPWPTQADGSGESLTRTAADAWGNAASSWTAASSSLGTTSFSTRHPGDANDDSVFNQDDLNQVLQSGKYMTGQPASFEEGDWNGDGVFDQKDIVLALQTGNYQSQAAAALRSRTSSRAAVRGVERFTSWRSESPRQSLRPQHVTDSLLATDIVFAKLGR